MCYRTNVAKFNRNASGMYREKVIFGWRRHLSRPVIDAISAPDCMDRPRIGHGIPKVARDGGGDHDHARQSGDDTA